MRSITACRPGSRCCGRGDVIRPVRLLGVGLSRPSVGRAATAGEGIFVARQWFRASCGSCYRPPLSATTAEVLLAATLGPLPGKDSPSSHSGFWIRDSFHLAAWGDRRENLLREGPFP